MPDVLVSLPATENPIFRRQDAPEVFEFVPLAYVARTDFIMGLTVPDYTLGRVVGVVVPEERALDIDTEMDFLFAEFLLKQKTSSCT